MVDESLIEHIARNKSQIDRSANGHEVQILNFWSFKCRTRNHAATCKLQENQSFLNC